MDMKVSYLDTVKHLPKQVGTCQRCKKEVPDTGKLCIAIFASIERDFGNICSCCHAEIKAKIESGEINEIEGE